MDTIICEQLLEESEILEAKKIVEKIYIREMYIDGNTKINTLSKYLDYKDSAIFGAKINGNLFGTISVVLDTEHGLLMDLIYKKELEPFRSSGNFLAEFTQFAVDDDLFLSLCKKDSSQSKMNLLLIFSKAIEYVIAKNVTTLCIAVNPKHLNFYKLLGFEILGGQKHYSAVNAPAFALVLDMKSETVKKRLDRVINSK